MAGQLSGMMPVVLLALVGLVAACDGGPSQPPPGLGEAVAAQAPDTAPGRRWPRLEEDGIHDPENPALSALQQPSEALSALPPAFEGNLVDWVDALSQGYINPRTNVFPETKIQVLDLDILMSKTAGMPLVIFPHREHTEWLDCANCHDHLFLPEAGANPITMGAILQGEFCGQCHGAVSFPLTQCTRCHSLPRGAPFPGSSG